MEFSTRWLADHVALPDDLRDDVEELARRLTDLGMAVEAIEAIEDDGSGEPDHVLDIEVNTNRPDAMCHLGLARELAAQGGLELTVPAIGYEGTERQADERTADAATVEIADPDLCSRYVALVVRGVTVGPSPPWLARRLEAIGLRPINNVVDVTNYVLWETGQPLHAFDLDTLARDDAGRATIVVRRAAPGEEALTTLDGEERRLDPDTLVIADAERPVALAGIMGGLDTEVGEGTADLLIESAWFDPATVRASAKRLGMHTDASHRFERGADPEAQLAAARRAADLIAETAGGRVLAGAVDVVARTHERPVIELDLDRLDAFAGAPIPRDRARAWLTGLGCEIAGAEGDGSGDDDGDTVLAVRIPSWRLFDLFEEADLFEEVLRLHGYGSIEPSLPAIPGADAPPTPRQVLRRIVGRTLASCGFAEAVNLAFLAPDAVDSVVPLGPESHAVRLANPLSEILSTLRRSLIPGLAAAADFNRRHGADAVRLFEIGTVFGRDGTHGPVSEHEAVALVAGGTVGTPWDAPSEIDFFDLKGVVEALADVVGVPLEALPVSEGADSRGFVPGATAQLRVRTDAGDGQRAGIIGQLDLDALGLEDEGYPVFAAELALAALELPAAEREAARRVVAPPRIPDIEVDYTLTHSVDVPWSDLTAAVTRAAPPELRRWGLENRYSGEGVPDGAINTTLYFVYNAGDRQLTQAEVNDLQAELTGTLEERFGRGAS